MIFLHVHKCGIDICFGVTVSIAEFFKMRKIFVPFVYVFSQCFDISLQLGLFLSFSLNKYKIYPLSLQ